ncbi:hypothetical protein [Rhodocaloribacter sp.]
MMPNPSASTSWSAHRPGSSRSSDHAPAAPSRHAATPPLLSLDEYVSIVTAGPRAMAQALGRYVRPPATLSAEAPPERVPPGEAATASPDAAPEAHLDTTRRDDAAGTETASNEVFRTDEPNVVHRDDHASDVPPETARHDDDPYTPAEMLLHDDAPEAPPETTRRDDAPETPAEMLWHDDAPETTRRDDAVETETASNEMRWEDEPGAGTTWPGEPAPDERPSDEAPVPDMMSTLTIPMPTVEDEPPTTASDMTETAPANAPSQPEEDRKRSDGARRWSWPWRS